ncbi:uncharacterized protein si:ch211-12e13.1 [Scomber scombrus]|uniref:Uncharacterized protein si:ch211-12e13.1 n=1 Tax=Scomber scombrus TaxID=13677 RepID=A0AAV1NK69_SCOSC
MGNTQSYIVASLSVSSVCLVYVYFYSSHRLLKTNVLTSDTLPSSGYLFIKHVTKALTRRTGCLYSTNKQSEVIYTVLNCRLETPLLRRFCSAGGYGWDYPDSEYRDIPLCFPEFLCRRLLRILLTDHNFRLSPAGLIRVRQSLKTHQPVDELKKGAFTLQVRVLVYRQVAAGVEVDICLSAMSRSGSPVWESVLTFLSQNKFHKASRCSQPVKENESQIDEPVPENTKQVELRVPWRTSLQCVWSFSDYPLLFLPARLFGCRLQTAPSIWMLSVCLAEIEKHKGVGVITAPVNITVQFKEPLLIPGKVTIKFWDVIKNEGRGLNFYMQRHGSSTSYIAGVISRS